MTILPLLNPAPQPGRQCGACSACCHLLPVRELDKPARQWCPECVPGAGCRIHGHRPAVCRAFECAWIRGAMGLTDADRPDKSGVIVCGRGVVRGREVLVAWLSPDRWRSGRADDLLGRLHAWAELAGRPVVLYVPFTPGTSPDTDGFMLELRPDGSRHLEPMPAGAFAPTAVKTPDELAE